MAMHFCHSREVWRDFPELIAGLLFADGITRDLAVDQRVARFLAIAQSRLATSSEGEFLEIQAWRRAFLKMGLKPTQYRCASESLLRRFRKEGSLPRIHPLIDLCNALSVAFAIPVAVFEQPEAREVIFTDGAGRAHARRWTNRQSGYSAVRDETTSILVVAEAMHASTSADVQKLMTAMAEELNATWSITSKFKVLNESAPRFDF